MSFVSRSSQAGLDERHFSSEFKVSIDQELRGILFSTRSRECIARTSSASNTEALSCSVVGASECDQVRLLKVDLQYWTHSPPGIEQVIQQVIKDYRMIS
jgi:hypothetical protein